LALINPDTGDLLQSESVEGSRGQRRAFYAGAELTGQGYTFIGFATAPKQGSPGKCQDDLFYVWTDTALQPLNQQQFGDPLANDLGLDLLFHDDRLFSAGVTSIDRPVAFVDGFLAKGGVPLSFRRSAGDAGRDHVSALAWHPLAEDYIAIGSWSESASGWYKAWWFRLDQDLVPTDELAFSAFPGSALNGLGILADGRTIAVGYVRPEEGDSTVQLGWSVDIDPGRSIPEAPTISFRPADASLPPLEQLPMEGGAYLAGEVGSGPLSFYHGESEPGSRHLVDLDVPSDGSLRIIVHPQGGDLDIALRREDGALVDFSNYRGGATELIEAALGPGRYRLDVLVNEAVEGFDVSLARAKQLAVLSPTGDAPLGVDARLQLASVLEGLGYFVGSEIEITVSPETIRAFAAIQSAVGGAVNGILDDGAWSQIVSR
jgi:hypothetical protein